MNISLNQLDLLTHKDDTLTAQGKRIMAVIGVALGPGIRIKKSTMKLLLEKYNDLQQRKTPHAEKLWIGAFPQMPERDASLFTYLYSLTRGWRRLAIAIGAYSVIGENVNIDPGVTIGRKSIISDRCDLNWACTIGHDVKLGQSVFIGKGTAVRPLCEIKDRVTVPPYALIPTGSVVVPRKARYARESTKLEKMLTESEESDAIFDTAVRLRLK